MSVLRFALLLLVTVIASAALVSLILREEMPAKESVGGGPAFPLLAEAPGAAQRIQVSDTSGSYILDRGTAASLWLVPEKGGYPADTQVVTKLLNDLAAMTLFEAKTAVPENLDLLGLAGPEKGPRIEIFDKEGAPLVDALIGMQREPLDRIGSSGTYLRYSDSDQAWLAEGQVVIPKTVLATLDQSLLRLPQSVIAEVEVQAPGDGKALVAKRAERGARDLILDPPASFGAETYQGPLRALASALAELVFDDVRPVEDLPMPQPWRATFTTFDGIRIALEFEQIEGALWARISASAVPPIGGDEPSAREDTQNFASTLNAQTSGWVYRLNPRLYPSLARTRASLAAAPSE